MMAGGADKSKYRLRSLHPAVTSAKARVQGCAECGMRIQSLISEDEECG
jgi:hypothetical protein